MKTNEDGEKAYYLLRSAHPSSVYHVRYVSADGTLNYFHASHGYGVAPACVIG